MNILLCCAAGMSTSIIVKKMRKAARELGYDQYKIASVDIAQVSKYIGKSDMVLLAPQVAYEYKHVVDMAIKRNIPVFIISNEDYGNMDGKSLLLKTQKQFNELHEEEIKMDTLSRTLEKYLLPMANKIGSNKVLGIIRNAMSATISLLIIGSISILLSNFPVESIAKFLEPANGFFNTIYVCTSGMMGLVTAVAIGNYASEEYSTHLINSILTSTGAFLISQSTIVDGWPTINVDGLGVSGLLTAIVVGVASVKVLQIFQERDIGIKMPEGVPPAVSNSFSVLLPSILALSVVTILTTVLGFNINEVIETVMSPLSSMLNTAPGYIVYHMLCALVFFCGINSAVVIGVVQAFLTQNSIANDAAYAAGETVKHVATNSVDTMVWAGGTGATIGLVILMVFISKSKMFKTLGRISLGPAIFNINEPIIFGVPIAFNPILLIPFILTPMIIAGGTYLLMSTGIIGMPILGNVPWTIPPVIIGFVMSGGAISTTIWSACTVLLSILIYYPFFRIADKQMYEREVAESKTQDNAILE